jgi:hypothetical protein
VESFVDKIARSLLLAKLASPAEIRGCTSEEVDTVERREAVKLPTLYKEFLLKMGKGAGQFLKGTDIFYEHLPRLRGWAEESLRESNSSFQLSKSFFVFGSHQGYEFMLLELRPNNEDPPVWIYSEGAKIPVQKWPGFSMYLQAVCVETVKLDGEK